MKTKHVVIILLLSLVVTIFGMLAKANSWRYADKLVVIANGLWMLGLILGLFKLLTHKKLKDIMNE